MIDTVGEYPDGVTVAELAAVLGKKANYFYRLLPDLAASGALRREGKKYFRVAQDEEAKAA